MLCSCRRRSSLACASLMCPLKSWPASHHAARVSAFAPCDRPYAPARRCNSSCLQHMHREHWSLKTTDYMLTTDAKEALVFIDYSHVCHCYHSQNAFSTASISQSAATVYECMIAQLTAHELITGPSTTLAGSGQRAVLHPNGHSWLKLPACSVKGKYVC